MATYLHGMFKWALNRELIQTNPAAHLQLPGRDVVRDRVLDPDEIKRVWAATHDPALPPGYGACVRILLLCGARRSEVANLAWHELDLTDPASATVRLAAERTKNAVARTIPLSAAARDIILALPRSGPYCFPSASGKPIARWSAAKRAIDGASGVRNWRLHDLRRTAATNLQRLGVKLETIEAILGHTSGSRSGVIGVYQRYSFADEARHAITAWSVELDRIVTGIAPAPNVLHLRQPVAP